MSKTALGQRITFEYGYAVRVDDEPIGPYPVFGSNGVTGYIDSFKERGPGIVIGRKGSVGKVAYTEGNFTPTDTAYFLRILNSDNDSLKFWYYFLAVLGIDKLNTHSAVPGLSRELAYLIEVDIPSFDRQQKIAAALTTLDAKIDCNNRTNAELEAMVKTLYDYWFVQFDFPDANCKPYKSSGGKMVYNAALKRNIPAAWSAGTLNDLGKIVGGSTPSTENPDNFTIDGTPWITPYDLSGDQHNKFISRGALCVSDRGIKNASLKKQPAGTVLLSSRAPIGYMAIARVELTTNQGFKSFVPSNEYSTAFIYYAVKGSLKTITQYASGSTFKEVSAAVLKTVKLAKPDTNIVDQFTNTVASILMKQDLLEQENQQLAALRDWLLPLLMNGQVTVA